MSDVFVRRSTGILILIICILSVISVALIAVLASTSGEVEDTSLGYSSTINDGILQPDKSTELLNFEVPEHPWEKNLLIPRSTYPLHYDLYLYPDLTTSTFTGKVTILVQVLSKMSYLVTHVKKMTVSSSVLRNSHGNVVPLKDSFEYERNQFWVILPEKDLQPGNYSWTFEFSGALKGHIVGFYESEYKTKDGQTRSIATSKFQPTDARRAFPCFDEPSFKSTFSTTLIRPTDGYIALSNMPVQKETNGIPGAGLTEVNFYKSVPMVTYLACFIVCDFDFVETTTRHNKPFRVYATKDQIERAIYARDIGVNILNYFEQYFEVDYPLPKQDQIAIPDFVSGAMEHWGLITYRETSLLYDDINSSSANKQRVAVVVSHELAHMWFGNLVTLKWWDDLWLNEGFASYMEYKGVQQYEKDWDMESQFVVSDLQRVFKLDEIQSSHPIVQEVNHPDEITEIFDAISYSKGASVLRMLEDFVGAEQFRTGVRNFLRRFSFKNAVTQDLWDDLQITYDKMRTSQDPRLNVTRVMNTWTLQMGFPVLNVIKQSGQEYKIMVRQNRFLIDGRNTVSNSSESPFKYKWDIPITYQTNSIDRKLVWMNMEKDVVDIILPSETRWVKLNVGQYGYYRVNYDEDMWTKLTQLLKTNHKTLSAADRSNLIDDSFSLAAAGQINYDIPFNILSYLSVETHYVPWVSAYSRLTQLDRLLGETKAYGNYRKFVLSLVDKHVLRVGWEDVGSHLERRTRIILLSLACSNGHRECLSGAVTRFKTWIKDPSYVIPANLRTLVYKYGIGGTGADEWEVLLDRFMAELNAQEKIKMSSGLIATKEKWVANRLLELAKNSTIIRSQDFFSLLIGMSAIPSNLGTVWSYVRTNWPTMVESYGLNNRYLGRMVRSVGFKFTTPLQLKELQTFFVEYPEAGSGKRGRKQALEEVNKNIQWIKTYSSKMDGLIESLIGNII